MASVDQNLIENYSLHQGSNTGIIIPENVKVMYPPMAVSNEGFDMIRTNYSQNFKDNGINNGLLSPGVLSNLSSK